MEHKLHQFICVCDHLYYALHIFFLIINLFGSFNGLCTHEKRTQNHGYERSEYIREYSEYPIEKCNRKRGGGEIWTHIIVQMSQTVVGTSYLFQNIHNH